VRTAIQTALDGFVYGFTAGGTPKRRVGLLTLSFAAGTLTVTKSTASFSFAVTQVR
jgi:hypothetical protein